MFRLVDSTHTGIDLINEVKNTRDFHVFRYRNFYNGGGVALGDVNNDGWIDVFFTVNDGKNKLYINKGGFQFEDVSRQAKIEGTKPWSTGVVMVDINNDGWLDIYVCNAGNEAGEKKDNELFINQKDGTFLEKAKAYNLAQSGITTHAAFFDYDKDGDLDVYLLNNSFIPVTMLAYENKRTLRDEDW